MNVFIDTNILLSLYQLSGPDLDELKKIIKLSQNGKIKIYLPQQVKDEFSRNRERVIKESVGVFEKSKANASLPNIAKSHTKVSDLRRLQEEFNQLVKEIKSDIDEQISDGKLKADELVSVLFSQLNTSAIDTSIIDKARLRKELGNPPGKNGNLGDSINWEWLLSNVPAGEDLNIVSSDSDYSSELIDGDIKKFLADEWVLNKDSEIKLYKGLPDLLKDHFPHIKLSDEIDKQAAINQLESSWAFTTTHDAISKLDKFAEFGDGELSQLINAYISNSQIHWILGDEDVLNFAKKILSLVKNEFLELDAYPLKCMVEEIEKSSDSNAS